MQYFAIGGNKSAVAAVNARSGKQVSHKRAASRHAIAGLLLVPLLTSGAMAHQGGATVAGANPLADKVHAANDRFEDVAKAKAEGYAPIPCVSGVDGGAMGIHFVSQQLIDDPTIDIAHPEAVMYEPGPDGKMTLIAVEYITPKGPAALDGHLFSFTNAPNRYGLPAFYELHVWAWKANPTGAFADMNPDVSCDAAPAE